MSMTCLMMMGAFIILITYASRLALLMDYLDTTPSTIMCCLCGTKMLPNAANMCPQCIRSQVDLSKEIVTQGQTLIMCKQCNRWQTKSKQFVPAELESRELLSLCLKFIQGLSKIRLVDAGFIWTEPHSRRIKMKVNVQKDILNGVEIQQRVEVEFVVRTILCDDCVRSESEQPWRALVQVRQRVEHKKTFYFLEQVLVHRKGLQDKVVDMEIARDGLDVYFGQRHDALQFCNLLSTIVPQRTKASRKLLHEDRQNNTHVNQHTFVVEIVPLCKDDLVLISPKAYGGSVSGLCLVSRVTSNVHMVEPMTLQRAEISATKYWRAPLNALMTSKDLVQYEVLDVELEGGGGTGGGGGGYLDDLASVTSKSKSGGGGRLGLVEVVKTSDFGVNDVTFHVMTHLAHLLQPGDTVMGYDLKTANLNVEEEFVSLKYDPPDVILVKKVSDPEMKREKRRLKRMMKRHESAKKKSSGGGKGEEEGEEDRDYTQFVNELDEDEDLWSRIVKEGVEEGTVEGEEEETYLVEAEEEGEGGREEKKSSKGGKK